MKILLASPFYSQHWDAGHYWARAFSRLGHELVLWDYRTDPRPPKVNCDLAVVMKGAENTAYLVGMVASKRICYWPDAFGRDPSTEQDLDAYNIVFTPIRPTPEGMVWLPGAWDEKVHLYGQLMKQTTAQTIFVGTRTDRKMEFLKAMQPTHMVGNGWPGITPAIYLNDYAAMLSPHRIAINIHRDAIGVNRRFFEMMACTFTITDRVPGVIEILGNKLAAKVTFETPEEGRRMIDHYMPLERECLQLWGDERRAIANYTYIDLARSIIDQVNALS